MPNGGNFPAEEGNDMPKEGNFPAEEAVPVEISAAWHAVHRRLQDALDSMMPKCLLVGILSNFKITLTLSTCQSS